MNVIHTGKLKSFSGTMLFLALLTFAFQACEVDNGPDDRDPFVDLYNVTDRCESDTIDYFIDIYKANKNGDEILIDGDGLFAIGKIVEAIVTGKKIVIPLQTFPIGSDPNLFYEFSGNGTLDGNVLTIAYKVLTVQGEIVLSDNDCIATCTKQ